MSHPRVRHGARGAKQEEEEQAHGVRAERARRERGQTPSEAPRAQLAAAACAYGGADEQQHGDDSEHRHPAKRPAHDAEGEHVEEYQLASRRRFEACLRQSAHHDVDVVRGIQLRVALQRLPPGRPRLHGARARR